MIASIENGWKKPKMPCWAAPPVGHLGCRRVQDLIRAAVLRVRSHRPSVALIRRSVWVVAVHLFAEIVAVAMGVVRTGTGQHAQFIRVGNIDVGGTDVVGGEIEFFVKGQLLQIRQGVHQPAKAAARTDRRLCASGWKQLEHVVIGVQGDADLFEIVLALNAIGRFTHALHRRHQQRDQDRDDGDDHQQLYEREAGSTHGPWRGQCHS